MMYSKAWSSFSGVSVASFSQSSEQTTMSSAVSSGKSDSRGPAPWAWSGSLSRAISMAVQDKRSIVVIARQDKVRSVPKGQVKLDTYRQRPYCAVVDQLEPLWFLANSALPTLGIPCRIVEGALRKVWLLVLVPVRWIESRFRFKVRQDKARGRSW